MSPPSILHGLRENTSLSLFLHIYGFIKMRIESKDLKHESLRPALREMLLVEERKV